MSIPAVSCSLIATRTASSWPSSNAPPSSAHGAHKTFGFASQDGLGKLPTMVVSSMESFLTCLASFRAEELLRPGIGDAAAQVAPDHTISLACGIKVEESPGSFER